MTNELAEEEAEKTMRTLDTNNSGSIDYSGISLDRSCLNNWIEFVNATIGRNNLLTKERLETAFKMFDKNGDGRISAEEMRFLFNEGKTQGIPEAIWKKWIDEVDKNSDGGVNHRL